MTVNEFREKYPEHQIQTTLRHYKPAETVKVGFFKTVSHTAECIIECKIISDKGLTVSTGIAYCNEDEYGGEFAEVAEQTTIDNAIDNLITKKQYDEQFNN